MAAKAGIRTLIWFLVLLLTAPTGLTVRSNAQEAGAAQAYTLTQEQLDQLLAPIALYPDSLLSQILMASTYPLEIVEANRWLKKNPGLAGDRLNDALVDKPWDVSVKSLCHFPRIIAMMDENLEQTTALGDAFLSQQDQVMDTVQQLREKAKAQGNLRSTEQQKVVVEGPDIIIEPVNPEVIYVPAYDPCRVYGPWWYPTCSPFWFVYPGLVFTTAFVFGPPVFFGHLGGWCGFFWRRHAVFVDVNRTIIINRVRPTGMHGGREVWQHNSFHRRGVAYPDSVTRARFGRAGGPGVEARRNFRGFGPPGGTGTGRPGIQPPPQRPRTQTQRPGPGTPGFQRQQPRVVPDTQQARPRRETTGTGRQGFVQPRSGETTFQGLGRGPEVRQQSRRGRESMGTMRGGKPSPGTVTSPGRSSGGGAFRGSGSPGGGSPQGGRSGGGGRGTGGYQGGGRGR